MTFEVCSNISNNIFQSIQSDMDDKQSFQGRVEAAREATNDSFEPMKVANATVPEKVIFCIDGSLGCRYRDQKPIRRIISALQNYVELKTRISTKPVEFGIVWMDQTSSQYRHFPFPVKKAVADVLSNFLQPLVEEKEPYDLSDLFTTLAKLVELPDPTFYSQDLPPPHVYHFILIFGRNRFVPTLKSPNGFFFLANNPFVCLDICYIYKCSGKTSKYQKIAQALKSLVNEERGYFRTCESCPNGNLNNLQSAFFEFLGHPLIRAPQTTCLFSMDALEHSVEK